MAITSENNNILSHRYRSSQFLYAMTYVAVTLVVLIFLNLYCSVISRRLIYRSKENSLVEKCHLAADELGTMEQLDAFTVSQILGKMESLTVTRLIVTDSSGTAVYDSAGLAPGQRVLLPEVLQALDGGDVFDGDYQKGVIICRASTPITHGDRTTGSVYMTEYDPARGALVRGLQVHVFQITALLELFVILFSLVYSTRFGLRMGRIMNSLRIIQSGDYSHKVVIGGSDELALLGREFNDLTDRLQISEQKRTRFVADASHEIKTPLASIKLLADSILQNDMDPATMREFAADIGAEAERLNRMTEKLLTLTKLDSEPGNEVEIIHMAPTVRRVSRILLPTAQAAGVTIRLELEEHCPVLILEDDLYQIVFNLMENGIKYNVPGGILNVHLNRDADNAVLTVSDTGLGIPEEALPHIFERFYRADKSRSRATGGSGLGLSIVYAFVQNNGGTIRAESREGQGSCFTVTFPLFDTEAAL
ncbi:MAG: ATP-binding protein [Faecousia sp.]